MTMMWASSCQKPPDPFCPFLRSLGLQLGKQHHNGKIKVWPSSFRYFLAVISLTWSSIRMRTITKYIKPATPPMITRIIWTSSVLSAWPWWYPFEYKFCWQIMLQGVLSLTSSWEQFKPFAWSCVIRYRKLEPCLKMGCFSRVITDMSSEQFPTPEGPLQFLDPSPISKTTISRTPFGQTIVVMNRLEPSW